MRLVVPGHPTCWQGYCSEITFELATRGSRAKRGGGYNLPLDPRPTLDAITQAMAAAMQKAGFKTIIPRNPEPFGLGGAFRTERWFATVPTYQHPGTSALAPTPGVMMEKAPHRPKPPRDPNTPFKPTRDWPLTSERTVRTHCDGKDECLYEPKWTDRGTPTAFFSGCNRRWRNHSLELVQAFTGTNPSIMFRRRHHPGCIGEIEPTHRCRTKLHTRLRGWPLAHGELCRLPDGRKFIISHPYCNNQLCGECLDNIAAWQREIPDLQWAAAGKERSWCSPGRSNLLLIGAAAVLETINLDYQVPDEHRPDGCVRHKHQF